MANARTHDRHHVVFQRHGDHIEADHGRDHQIEILSGHRPVHILPVPTIADEIGRLSHLCQQTNLVNGVP